VPVGRSRSPAASSTSSAVEVIGQARMRLLLDTDVLLCAIAEAARLSKRARRLLGDESNDLLLSTASIWEIQLKRRAGKLTLPAQPGFLQQHILRLGVQEV